ncbi:hypothetical protein E3P86_01088 [Wallemia ichthyophaga]|uniref:methionyl-tRNA formyltransferase n=1 Tax=Wallemia ichthyophaga TaxID=245174 RepID=A0A4T0J9P1_WALIC|nr:hypothetical protein E3P86_01088 [Wallemia ichthyophaga]
MRRPLHILFLGSDDFSVDVLRAVWRRRCSGLKQESDGRGDVDKLSVITPAPARTGRGKKQLRVPPLLEQSQQLQLPTYTPTAGELPHMASHLPALDVILTASYGHLLPTELLRAVRPQHAINVHPSLLPALRGAAPIQWAIARQLRETGVSIQTMQDDVFDSGEILLQRTHPLSSSTSHRPTTPSLAKELGLVAGEMAAEVLENLDHYIQHSYAQDTARITHAPKVGRTVGFVDFACMAAETIDSRHRAFSHQRPLSATLLQSNTTHQLLSVEVVGGDGVVADTFSNAVEGSASLIDSHLVVKCARSSYLRVHSLKPPGKHAISAHEWWNGHRHGLNIVNFTKPSL